MSTDMKRLIQLSEGQLDTNSETVIQEDLIEENPPETIISGNLSNASLKAYVESLVEPIFGSGRVTVQKSNSLGHVVAEHYSISLFVNDFDFAGLARYKSAIENSGMMTIKVSNISGTQKQGNRAKLSLSLYVHVDEEAFRKISNRQSEHD